jgi:hypothetical protein
MSNPFAGFRSTNSEFLQGIWDKAWNDARSRQAAKPLTEQEKALIEALFAGKQPQKNNTPNKEGK